MEMLCRQRAVLECSNGEKWLARAEGWRELAYQETAARFHGIGENVKEKNARLPAPSKSS
jgi:hypothetical protein